jgi:hypothetical protein
MDAIVQARGGAKVEVPNAKALASDYQTVIARMLQFYVVEDETAETLAWQRSQAWPA